MENKKYTVDTIIRRYKQFHGKRWTSYGDALDADERDVLKFASARGFVLCENDAPRGGKHGELYRVVKPFSTLSIRRKMLKEVREREAELADVLKSEPVDKFYTISDVGSILVDGVGYSNYCGDCENRGEIYKCNPAEFKTTKYVSRRQVFNKNSPLTVIKFDEPKTIKIAKSDVDASFGEVVIENALGFTIWEQKIRVFVAE